MVTACHKEPQKSGGLASRKNNKRKKIPLGAHPTKDTGLASSGKVVVVLEEDWEKIFRLHVAAGGTRACEHGPSSCCRRSGGLTSKSERDLKEDPDLRVPENEFRRRGC